MKVSRPNPIDPLTLSALIPHHPISDPVEYRFRWDLCLRRPLEGRGVQPDVVVEMDWRLYGSDDDPQIQAAMEVLGSE